jgi:hypothetical protein
MAALMLAGAVLGAREMQAQGVCSNTTWGLVTLCDIAGSDGSGGKTAALAVDT